MRKKFFWGQVLIKQWFTVGKNVNPIIRDFNNAIFGLKYMKNIDLQKNSLQVHIKTRV